MFIFRSTVFDFVVMRFDERIEEKEAAAEAAVLLDEPLGTFGRFHGRRVEGFY